MSPLRPLLIILVFIFPLAADGQQDPVVEAKQLYERGMAHFQLEEFDAAIEKWQAGFRMRPVPEFLYNIGQAYRLSRRPEKAIAAYKGYLRMSPRAANRNEVERQVSLLTRLIEHTEGAATAPPTEGAATAPPTEPLAHPEPTAPSVSCPFGVLE
jgi:tetratricopeptide (TPR) repeat protein